MHISHARAEFSGTLAVFLVDREGGEKGFGRSASAENTRSNQDKVDVKPDGRVWIKTISVFVQSVIRARARASPCV